MAVLVGCLREAMDEEDDSLRFSIGGGCWIVLVGNPDGVEVLVSDFDSAVRR